MPEAPADPGIRVILVTAPDADSAARLARAANRVFGRSGPVLDGRYHARVLRTPSEVRNALAYVLLNVRKHFRQRRGIAPPVQMDEASSGRWFDGWRGRPRSATYRMAFAISPPTTAS